MAAHEPRVTTSLSVRRVPGAAGGKRSSLAAVWRGARAADGGSAVADRVGWRRCDLASSSSRPRGRGAVGKRKSPRR